MKHITTNINKIILFFILFFAGISLFTGQNFKQQDDRKWSIDPRMTKIYPTGDYVPLPQSDNYVHPNTSPMIYYTPAGVLTVAPNFRVYPSNVTQSEVPICRHPTNQNIMFASSNAVSFSPTFISEGVYVTTNGGVSWFGSDTTAAAPLSGHGGDPAPAIAPNGYFHQSFLGSGMNASYSTDNGLTWSNTYKITTGSQDKNYTFINDVSSSSYYGRVYVTWSLFTESLPPAVVSYSTNNGVSFGSVIHVNTPASGHYSQGVNGAIAPNGDAYICWMNPVAGSPYTGDYLGFGISTDGGNTWNSTNNVYDCNTIRGTLSQKSDIRVNGYPWMGVDRTGGSRAGWIYIVTGEKNLSPAGSDPDIIMHRSTDGGSTWSAGIRVNQDPLNNGKIQFFPCIRVDEEGGLNAVYYDDRNTSSDSSEVYLSRSTDGGDTWTDILVSDHRFKPKPISGLASGYQGDYIGITSGNGKIWPYWCSDISGIYQAWITSVNIGPSSLWTGTTSTDWSTSSNWSDGNVPTSTVDVTIPSDCTYYPVVDETAACDDLTINDDGLLTVNTGAALSIGGSLAVGGGTSGEFEMNAGTCTVTGNLYSATGCTVDINGGTLNINDWRQSAASQWSKGTIQLSGGTINASGIVYFSASGVTGSMDGSFNFNIGDDLYINNNGWSTVTGGTITMQGTGTSPFFIVPSNTSYDAIAFNLVIDGTGEDFYFCHSDGAHGIDIKNNLNINAGTAYTKNGSISNDDFAVTGSFTVGSGATFVHGDIPALAFSVGSWSLDPASTYSYNGSSAQTILSTPAYGNLSASGSGEKTPGGNLGIAGYFDIGFGSTVNGGTVTFTVNGNWNIDGTFNYQTSSVVLNNTSKGDNVPAPRHPISYNKTAYSETENTDSKFSEIQTIKEDNYKQTLKKDIINLSQLKKDRKTDQYINSKDQRNIRDINLKVEPKTRNYDNPKGDGPKGNQNMTGGSSGGNLTTTFAAGNGASSNYFDISATGGVDVTVNTYDLNTSSTGTVSAQVWYRTDTYVGHTTDPAGWVQVGTTQSVTGQGEGNPTPVNPGATVTIPNGSTYGFFISCTSIRYTNGSNTYNDSYLTIECGLGSSTTTPGGGGTFNPRKWNGTVYYSAPGLGGFNFYDLTINTDGTVTTINNVHCYNNFTNGSAAVLNMGSNVLTVDETYTNNGEIKSENTETCPSGVDTDINGPEGSNDALTFNPAGDMGSTTVTTHAGVYHSQGTYGLKRWWDINPTTGQTCTITLRMRDEETTNITDWPTSEPWEWNGSSWTQNGTYSSHSSSGGFTSVTYTGFTVTGGKAPNVITLSNNDPLPVGLISFNASVNKNNVTLNWTTAWELNNAGFDIERQSLAIKKNIWTKIGYVEGNGTTNEPTNYIFADKKLNTGKYNYRLVQRDYNNRGVEHFLSDVVTVGIPKKYAISQNYPNPFNPTTKIDYDLPYNGKVNIVVYDITGREIATIVNEVHTAGYYTAEFNASHLASGVYFYRIIAKGGKNDFIMTKKMVLIK